jgi:outer membrane PBP1 activator LpoA protein
MRIYLPSMHTFSRLVIAVLILSSVGACASLSLTREDRVLEGRATHAQARMRAGDFIGAASEYLRLAQASRAPASHKYVLHAAEAYLAGRHVDEAKRLLIRLQIPADEVDLNSWKKLLWARVALLKNDPREALATLDTLRGVKVPTSFRKAFHHYRAEAYSIMGDLLKVAHEHILLQALLTDPNEQRKNQHAIWEAVNSLKLATLSRRLPAELNALRGWMELAIIIKSPHPDSIAFKQSLDHWQQRFPDHPATQEILANLIEISPNLYPEIKKIALLLPLTGKFAEAATAIQDGFITAWYNDPSTHRRPLVNVYDTNTTSIDEVYQTAVDEGADLVVGPLEKPTIEALVRRDSLPVTTLALNQLDLSPAGIPSWTPKHDKLYQFGLSPEDEARQIAERAWLDGHMRAIALTPESEWGKRVFKAFEQRWETLGGQLLTHRSYTPNKENYSLLAREVLQTVGSKPLIAEARAAAGEEHSEPRPRRDADFVFLAGFPGEIRQIQPDLVSHSRGTLPVYSTSHVYSGMINRSMDSPLNGIIFGDMPWILGPSPGDSTELRDTVLRNWPKTARTYPRLYAFGIDAYHILPQIELLRAHAFARFVGETGRLRMDQYGRIHRQLSWARFVNGMPTLLGENPPR